jgi:hypothetical protein
MPYLAESHRVWLSKTLESLLEYIGWNVALMGSREDTVYHIVMRLVDVFYGSGETDFNSIHPSDPEKRRLVEKTLKPLIQTIQENPALLEKKDGTLNYTICRILNAFYPREHSRYSDYNKAIGVLETVRKESKVDWDKRYDANGMLGCVIQEYYIRRVRAYEEEACNLNGDVFE